MLNLLDKQMTMNKYYKNPIFGLLLLFLTTFLASFPTVLQAQVFPTSATVRLVPPYNTFLSELSQGNSDKVQVILLQRDQSVPSYDVRLKFKVKLAGNVIFETAPSFVSPIINLEQNTPIVLSGADLSTYFQANNLVFANANLRNIYVNNGQIPEGLYEFCATVYSATRADRQLSNNACQIFSLSRSLPPLLNLPACGGAIPEPAAPNPLNLRFWWTPQHNSSVNSAANTSYVLEIFEILNADGNANNAVLSSSPVFSFPTPLTQYFYSISDPNFVVGRRYAWRVRVIDDSNRDAFINNGYSAVCEFTYAPTLSNGQTLVPILAPSNIQAEGKGNRAGRVWWSAFVGATIDRPDRYKVEYKKVGVGLEWFSEFTTTDELVINQGLEPATTYEARVQGEKGGFLGDASSIVTFTTFIPVAAVCGVTPTNALANMTPMRNARIGMPIEVTGFEVVLDSLESESTPGVYSGRGLIKIPFMLNQTFTVLFESLFINELGQAGEGKVWFKTKPIEEWIAENTPPISEQPISFMDFEPGTTVFPVVITGIVVLPNGQVTVVTPNGTFLADTTLIPRPVLKPTVIEDKNGNQFIVHPDGTVTALGQAGFIPKPMTTEEKLDKIRRGLYLEALKDYKTQIETYYTSKNEPIPTRGPRNHNKNIIIDLPECIGTEANEIKDNFLAIKDNVNKKELREKSLKRILEIIAKKGILDGIAQTALNNLTARVKITESEFRQFLSTLQFIAEMEAICGEWGKLEYIRTMYVNLYPGSAGAVNFTTSQLNIIKERAEKILRKNALIGIFDVKFQVKNTPLCRYGKYGYCTVGTLEAMAEQELKDCHVVVNIGDGGGYAKGATSDLYDNDKANNLHDTWSVVSVSDIAFERPKQISGDPNMDYYIFTEDIQLNAAAFTIAHELWHQLMNKSIFYLARSYKKITDKEIPFINTTWYNKILPTTKENITLRTNILEGMLFNVPSSDPQEGHNTSSLNLNLDNDGLLKYGSTADIQVFGGNIIEGIPHGYYLFKGSTYLDAKPEYKQKNRFFSLSERHKIQQDEEKCFSIISIQNLVLYEFMKQAYGITR